MEWVKDLQAQTDENSKKIDQLIAASKKAEAINATAAAQINRAVETMRSLNSTCENAVESVKRLNNSIPKSARVQNEYEWSIKPPTMIWITCILIGIGFGFWLIPKAVNTAKNQSLKWELQEREEQIEKFRNNGNEKTAKQYFGD